MTTLSPKPGSSTPSQRSRLVILGKCKGFDIDEIRSMVGGSVRKLSAQAASGWIEHFGGGPLPNPPGEKPSAYKGKKKPGSIRMITVGHVEQILHLGHEYFDRNPHRFASWLAENFKISVDSPPHYDNAMVNLIRHLGTAERAGQVIRVLKTMLARREERRAGATGTSQCSSV